MAEPARALDRIDTAPAFDAEAVAAVAAQIDGLDTVAMLERLLHDIVPERAAVVSSFGAESAVLLHLVSTIDRSVPLIFVNTQKMFGDTLAYRDELAERLGFTDLRVVRPDPYLLAQKDATGLRWSYDPDGCCEIRKVEPLRRGLAPFDAWISGRKGFQTGRAGIPRVELDEGRLKINPLAGWSKTDLDAYFAAHDLPRHPMEAQGYPSIGCSPCTSKVLPGEDPRAGRWRGWDKVECGIHSEVTDDPAF